MILFKKASDLSNFIRGKQSIDQQVGFVPTMGALHQGHLSLINASKNETDLTVCSIFVNPTQFNDPKDFQKYPVTIEKDIYMLEKNGTELLFLPPVEEIYPDGTTGIEIYPLGYLETVLEGKYRPGHFQGVCQVMHRLLNIVKPDHLFMGQKDYQQCMIIKKLIALTQLRTIFHGCPTLRETDGLAMSSRNTRLNELERKKAIGIYDALSYIKKNLSHGNLSDLIDQAKKILAAKDFKIDYVETANADSLESIHEWNGKQKLIALIAAFQGEVRLIDNMILTPE